MSFNENRKGCSVDIYLVVCTLSIPIRLSRLKTKKYIFYFLNQTCSLRAPPT